MSEITEDMVDGLICSHCGIYFLKPHGYPVLCEDCYSDETKEERAGLQKTSIKELSNATNKKIKNSGVYSF